MNDLKLKDLQLYKELNDKYYLSAVFDQEDETGFYEISVPKILFPIAPNCSMDVDTNTTIFGDRYDYVAVDFGIVRLYAEPFDYKKNFYTKKLISEKTHEMTLEEIERELGYRIKLKESK